MAIFRDLDGNLFNIPASDLTKYRVEGELPEDAILNGGEIEAPFKLDSPTPNYVWPSATPNYVWPSAAAQQQTSSPNYVWPSAVMH